MLPARAARLLFQLPQNSRVFIKLQPANQWGFAEVFQNKMVFLLETIVWQNGYDSKKKAKSEAAKPKLYVPPFLEALNKEKTGALNKGLTSHSTEEIDAILAKKRV